ncbi:P-loop containing nucleoside triphosphate hydrolase protein [Russula earlei]|uniref:P-loop containing nucleoside triphosphate hydrolase protein n=1 Tax=Russula earlei TaxID=71964 RepID=A0ACC0U9A3_9AGAM|nr:P-loop containing nucleoside triphosphate hydrolase protein [Russula earlei]
MQGEHQLRQVAPLADVLRPKTLQDVIGQAHITGPDTPLFGPNREFTAENIIFWGPPGCGKTTIARVLGSRADTIFREVSATITTMNQVRSIFEEAGDEWRLSGRRTTVFLDEIHRFTRSQQDVFIPFIEQGLVQIIGATTENPSFEMNRSLLDLCRVYVLERLTDEEITRVIDKVVARIMPPVPSDDDTPVGTKSRSIPYPHLSLRIINTIASLSCGDARTALSLLELVLICAPTTAESELIESLRRSVSTSYDRTGDARYDLISALHKSVRGSQPSAALYWLARMLEAGEDPAYIARRMVVCASEDIGIADRGALPLAMATLHTCQNVGMPGCRASLAELIAYLAEAPKSTRAYEGYHRAERLVKRDSNLLVPIAMRDMPMGSMETIGHGEAYKHPVTNEYLPSRVQGEIILRRDGDFSDKVWDEDALRRWEAVENGGREWSGRHAHVI